MVLIEEKRVISGHLEVKDWVSLTAETVDVSLLIEFTKSSRAGAISSFFGTTRDTFEEKIVTYLEYEAYNEMAITTMLQICDQIRNSWDIVHIAIQHKIGPCPVMETSIAIVISSPHRKDSLQAIQFAIDELKRTVPIWKKEHYQTGEATWKENLKDSSAPPIEDTSSAFSPQPPPPPSTETAAEIN